MDYIITYFIIGYFISLGFNLIIYFLSVEEEFAIKEILGVMVFWPLVTHQFIKELINNHDEFNERR
jgi:hypothetical protein